MPWSLCWVEREPPSILEKTSLKELGEAFQALRQTGAWALVHARLQDLMSQALLQEREAEVGPDLYMLRGAIQTLEAILEIPAEVRARMEELADGRA